MDDRDSGTNRREAIRRLSVRTEFSFAAARLEQAGFVWDPIPQWTTPPESRHTVKLDLILDSHSMRTFST